MTFAPFMQACLYSPHGGCSSARGPRISTHFGTSLTSQPVFGALLARPLEHMWHLRDAPPVFPGLEVGAGAGAVAPASVQARGRMAPRVAQGLSSVAAAYEPGGLPSPAHPLAGDHGTGEGRSPRRRDARVGVQRVNPDGLRAFHKVVGCGLGHELLETFPVHRVAIQGGSVQEVFVTVAGGTLPEGLDEPSSPRLAARLTSGGVSLPEGYRGEVHWAREDRTGQLAQALDRGFTLTIAHAQRAPALYALPHHQGTRVCYHRHVVSRDPYQHLGHQDMTGQVDVTSLRRLGDRHGLATVGYPLPRQFRTNLGFAAGLEVLQTHGLSAARTALRRMAMMTSVDPEEDGDFTGLAQAQGHGVGLALLGVARQGT